MSPEHSTVAWSSDEEKWLVGMFVDCRIELTDNIVEDARRNSENRAAISAIGRVADAIGRFPGEEHGLVHVGGNAAAAEVSGEGAMTHEHDVVRVRLFLRAWSAASNVTAVVVHADDRALVQRAEDRLVLSTGRHHVMVLRTKKLRDCGIAKLRNLKLREYGRQFKEEENEPQRHKEH